MIKKREKLYMFSRGYESVEKLFPQREGIRY